LLRPQVARGARVALLAVVLLAIAAPAARAASPVPDPSPRSAAVTPDAYPDVRAPSGRAPAVVGRGVDVRRGVQTVPATPSASVPAPARAAAVATPTHPAPAKKHARPKPVVPTTPVETIRAPDHSAPQLATLARAAVDSPKRVSLTLALALGLLILISASLVAGAARELAR